MAIQEAYRMSGIYHAWMVKPSDGSAPLVFINQDSATAYQDSHPDEDVLAVVAISAYDPRDRPLNDIYIIGETKYPISGDQLFSPDTGDGTQS